MPEVGLLAGLRQGLAPMVGKEFRSRTRGWRSPLLISVYLLLLGGGPGAFFYLGTLGVRYGALLRPETGLQLFVGLAVFQLLALLFVVPAITAGAISGERERRTIDLLMVTPASALGVVLGKLVAALSYVFLLLVASLPVYGLVYFFGGVPPAYLGMVLAVSAMTALLCGTIGIFASVVFRRTQVASVTAYVLILFLLFGTAVGAALMSRLPAYAYRPGPPVPGGPAVEGDGPRIPSLIYANPLVALVSVLPGGQSVPVVREFLFLVGREMAVRSNYVYTSRAPVPAMPAAAGTMAAGRTGEPQRKPLEFWVYNFIFDAVSVLLLLAASALLLPPVRPWHRWRAARRRRAHTASP